MSSKPPVHINKLRFNDGTELAIQPSTIVVLVGANNVGKSKALQNIAAQTGGREQDATDHSVVKIEIEWEIDKDAAINWFEENFSVKSLANGDFYEARGHRVQVDRVANEVRSGGQLSTRVGKLISIYANAEERLSLTHAVSSIDLLKEQPQHPVHILADDSVLIEKFSELTSSAFGSAITLDTTAGNTFVVRMGVPDVEPKFSRHGVGSREYVEALRGLPTLENQGHGIRSYAGMLMELLVGSKLFVLVDEPEAFLHPPQAEKIGSAISAIKSNDSQVFVATHDANVVKGFLSSPSSEDVVVVRIQRSGETNPVSVLESKDLEALWSDPSLRYSNVLDGLFSEGTVVCEGDPDCRLYQSATDAIDDKGTSGIHFTHGGGTGRIPVIASALTAVSVPTATIIDLDVLGERPLLKKVVASVGGIWPTHWDTLLNVIDAGVCTLAESFTKATIAKIVAEALQAINDEDVPDAASLKRIQKSAKSTTGWQKLKKGGKSALPAGQCAGALNTLLEQLAETGVFVVPVGELEGWFPTIGGHGPVHVSDVHQQGLMETSAADSVKVFVERVRTYLSP